MPIPCTVEEFDTGGLLRFFRRQPRWEALLCDYEVTGYTKHALRLQCGGTRPEYFDRWTGLSLQVDYLRLNPREVARINAEIRMIERRPA